MSERARGRPARISKELIVAAAHSLSLGALTMQGVADALGVTRKALHYYVGDREGLLTLVTLDLFEREVGKVELPAGDDWRAVLRAYAIAFRDGLIQVGTATEFTQLRGIGASAALALADRVLDALLGAGLDPDAARLGLTAASNIAQSAAQGIAGQTPSGAHRHRAETSAALLQEPDDTFPALRTVLAAAESQRHDAETQFDFELGAVIAELERLLVRTSASG
jgi:AcrR family transcriptional regulator